MVFGWVLVGVGSLTFIAAFSSDTTVLARGSDFFNDRVHNTGLMQQQLIGCLAGMMMVAVGLILAALGSFPRMQ